MKRKCSAFERSLADALFDTLEEAERDRLQEHLAACPACAQAFREMQAVLQVTAVRTRPEPPDVFWDGYYDRLATRLDAGAPARPAAPAVPWWQRWEGRLWPAPRWALQLAAAILLVGLGVFIGRYAFDAGAPAPPVAVREQPPLLPEGVAQAALEERTRHYLNRSKVLLLGLVHFDAAQEDPVLLNLPRKQAVARALVQEADSLKRQLGAQDERRLQELVSDLEVILMQIANLEASRDVPAIELVRSGVDRRALLLKINLAEMRLDEPARMDGDI
jgi:hypothetical protein